MDGFTLVLWGFRLLFLLLLYVFLARVIRALLRDLRAAARETVDARAARGPRVAGGEPEAGRSFGLDVITPLGRDVNNAIVIDDPFASADHAVLTYRGRSWYLEDLGSTNGSYINGQPDRRRRGAGLRRRGADRPGPLPPRTNPPMTVQARRPSRGRATGRAGAAAARSWDRSGRARAGRSSGCSSWSRSPWWSAASRSAPPSPGTFGPRDPWGLGIYLGVLARRPRRPGPGRPPDGPDPAAGRRDARRALAAADGAAAAGPRHPAVLRHRRSGWPRSS